MKVNYKEVINILFILEIQKYVKTKCLLILTMVVWEVLIGVVL